jgi:hypothetical protein
MNAIARTLLFVLLRMTPMSLQAQHADVAPAQQHAAPAASSNSGSLARAQQSLDEQSPLFIENRGQWDRRARFLLRSGGLNTWITDHGLIYDLYQLTPSKASETHQPIDVMEKKHQEMTRHGHVVSVEFLGASFAPTTHGQQRQPGYHNYFIGNDPASWATNVPLYAQAQIDEIYPGINAVFYLDEGAPRYDLVVSPGGDPAQVRMHIDGATAIGVTPEGSLSMMTSLGQIEQRGLYAYQPTGATRQQVRCSFLVDRSGEVRFDVGSYDRTRPLVIDPLTYSTYLGGEYNESGNAIAVDANHCAYVTGTTYSPDFPTTVGAYDAALGGSTDAFVTKLNATGNALVFSTYLGGNLSEDGNGIALDGNNNVYVTGTTWSTNFPTTGGAYDATLGGTYDAFVTKLNSTGATLTYSTYLGGGSNDIGRGIAVVGTSAFVTGYTSSTNFPTTGGVYDMVLGGGTDAFVTRFSTGGTLAYSTFLGGTGSDYGAAIAVDATYNAHVTGTTYSTNFPTTVGAFDAALGGTSDAFVTKLNSTGAALSYSTYLGGSDVDAGNAIAINTNGNAFVTGYTYSTNFPTTAGAYDVIYNGNLDAFVTKLNGTGGALVFSTYLGGTSDDVGCGIAVDGTGVPVVTGYTYSAGFPTNGAYDPILGGSVDGFLSKLNGLGGILIYSTFLGGDGDDRSYGITVDGNYSAYITGRTASTNFPTTVGVYDATLGGSTDAFVMKFATIGIAPYPFAVHPVSSGDENAGLYEARSMDDAQLKSVAGEAIAEQRMSLQLIPNPITSDGRLRVSLTQPGTLGVTIYDMLGHPVRSFSGVDVEKAGELEIPIDVSDLGSGSYTIEVVCNDQRSSTRLHVVR